MSAIDFKGRGGGRIEHALLGGVEKSDRAHWLVTCLQGTWDAMLPNEKFCMILHPQQNY